MSRTIDLSEGHEALDDDEVLYLAQRDDRKAQEEVTRRGLTLNGDQVPVADQTYYGDANTKGVSEADLEAMAAQSPHHNVDEDDDDFDEDDDDLDEDESETEMTFDDYMAWTANQLRAELAERKLSVDGKKEELAQRLVDDDRTDESDSETSGT